MHMKNFMKSVGGALAMLLMALAFSVTTGTTTQAQSRQYPGARDGQYRRDHDRDHRHDGDRDRNNDRYRGRRDDRYGRNNGYGNNGVYGNTGGYGRNGGYNNAYRVEQERGYQAGVNTGASDAQRGQSFNPQRSHYYRDASSQAFRDGFVQGYEQGYRQYGGYNNNGRYRRSSNVGRVLGDILGRP